MIPESRRRSHSVSRYYSTCVQREDEGDNGGAVRVNSLFGYDEQIGAQNYDFGIAAAVLHSNFTDPMRHRSLKIDLVEHNWANRNNNE
jgi:hypothetical protein